MQTLSLPCNRKKTTTLFFIMIAPLKTNNTPGSKNKTSEKDTNGTLELQCRK